MSNDKDAAKLFRTGFNCSQSVLSSFGEKLGIDPDTAVKIATAFGGGMGRTGDTCGAVTGALMVIGLKFGPENRRDFAAKGKTYELTREFLDKFNERNSSLACRDLLGFDISLKENNNPESEKIISEKCAEFVKDAEEILQTMI